MSVFGRVHTPPLGGATGWRNAEPLSPAELRGRIACLEENGVLEEGRLYQLVRQRSDVRDRTLDTTFLRPGAAYAFTYG